MTTLPVPSETPSEKFQEHGPLIQVGQWYWLKVKGEKEEVFTCVTHLGSNFIRLDTVDESHYRIHENEFHQCVRRELDPESVIKSRTAFYQDVVRDKLGEIKELTARLGLTPQESTAAPAPESRELSVMSGTVDLKKHKKELMQAKEKKLPELFKEVEEAHQEVATWTLARTLPMKGMTGDLKGCIAKIEDRVFNISLYAGLTEEIEQILDGEPAAAPEKLHLFQRLCYMDEESLAHYKIGGMEYEHIGDFDTWISEKENFERILPFPRSMVAFRVRRNTKYRSWDGSLGMAMLIARLQQLDDLTFMYIRNGRKLYRMNCDQDFGEYLFPSKHQIDLSEPMMAKRDIASFADIITKRDYDEEVRKYQASIVKAKEDHRLWKKENPKKDEFFSPHYHHKDENPNSLGSWRDYTPFNKSSVYFDDISEEVEKQIKYYNRIVLILQGILDRSEILHPHAPAKLWTPQGMEALIELVYDGAGAIHYQDPPDFEVYRNGLNDQLKQGSMTIGQDDLWQRREADIEWSRRSWRSTGPKPEHTKPYGDPGPGYVAPIAEWNPKKRLATFRWMREPRSWGSYWDFRDKHPIPCRLLAPMDRLFNVSAYRPGDFRQFYQDPRTRAKYLQWAELMLEAEEYHAGNLASDGTFTFKKKKKARKK